MAHDPIVEPDDNKDEGDHDGSNDEEQEDEFDEETKKGSFKDRNQLASTSIIMYILVAAGPCSTPTSTSCSLQGRRGSVPRTSCQRRLQQ